MLTSIRSGAILMVAGLVAGLSGYQPAQAAESSWVQIESSGIVRICSIPNRPPYFYADPKNPDKWLGFNADMSRAIGAALTVAMGKEIKVDWVRTSFQTLVLDMQSGKIDVCLGMTFTEERDRALSMFGPLWFVPNVALDHTGFAPGVNWSDYDKPGTKVSVVMGSTDETAARAHLKNATIRSMKGMAEAVLDVQSGNSDAMITSVFNGLGALKQNPRLGKMTLLQPPYALPTGGGTRRDGDGRLYTFLQGWAWGYRVSGLGQKDIIAAMKAFDLPMDQIPSELKF